MPVFPYTSDPFWSLRTRLGPASSKLKAKDSSSVDTATDAIYKPRTAYCTAISILGIYHFILYLKILPVFICIWASNTSETINILKITVSSPESERKGILIPRLMEKWILRSRNRTDIILFFYYFFFSKGASQGLGGLVPNRSYKAQANEPNAYRGRWSVGSVVC